MRWNNFEGMWDRDKETRQSNSNAAYEGFWRDENVTLWTTETIEPLNPCTHSYHAHVEHTKTLQGLDTFDIWLPDGSYKPAKYIKIKWGEDPLIYGMIDGNPYQYVKSFQANPMPSAGGLCTYTLSQLKFFEENHDLHPEMDEAAHQLYDQGVMAEIECYRRNKVALECDLREEAQIQNDIWKQQLTLAGCAHRMAGAWVLQRIKVVNRSKLCLLMQEYKHCHGRQS